MIKYIYAFIGIFLINSCNSVKKNLPLILKNEFKSSIDFNECLKSELNKFNIKSFFLSKIKIKDGVLSSYLKPKGIDQLDDKDFYFLVFDLKSNNLIFFKKNPIKDIDFINVDLDFEDNTIFVISKINKYKCIYTIDIFSNKIDKIILENINLQNQLGSILVKNKNVLFYNSLYGSGVLKLRNYEFLSLMDGFSTMPYLYSNFSIPMDNKSFLISGIKNGNENYYTNIIDSNFNIQSEFFQKKDTFNVTNNYKIINTDSGFCMFRRHSAQFVGKYDGVTKWFVSYTGEFENAFLQENCNFICTLSENLKTSLIKIDFKSGKIIFKKQFDADCSFEKNFYVNHKTNTVLLCGRDSIWSFKITDTFNSISTLRNNQEVSFIVIPDLYNYDSYVFSKNYEVFW